jgi:hypothetical protein
MNLVARCAIGICMTFWLLASSSAAHAEAWTSVGPLVTLLSNNDVISGQTNAVAIDRARHPDLRELAVAALAWGAQHLGHGSQSASEFPSR